MYNHRHFKLLDDRVKNYEVLIPNKFTPRQPWGSFPEGQWNGVEILAEQCYPVPEDMLNSDDHDPTTHIPIHHVFHITHKEPARSINSTLPDGYTFKPMAKLGKQVLGEAATSGSIGETYKQIGNDKFEQLHRSEMSPVFPGYLSWWGMDVGGDSRYGNSSYSLAFPDLLTSYQTARKDKPGGEVQLKVGGTLLYKLEICYVVMVGLKGDKELQSMPSMGDYEYCRPFQHNGLITSHGRIIKLTNEPNFRSLDLSTSKNWEQLVFALYFPNIEQQLVCRENIVEYKSVAHNDSLCMSKKQFKYGKKWKCPDSEETQA